MDRRMDATENQDLVFGSHGHAQWCIFPWTPGTRKSRDCHFHSDLSGLFSTGQGRDGTIRLPQNPDNTICKDEADIMSHHILFFFFCYG